MYIVECICLVGSNIHLMKVMIINPYARYTRITFYAVTTYATYADQYANIST